MPLRTLIMKKQHVVKYAFGQFALALVVAALAIPAKICAQQPGASENFSRLAYNNPELTVDLGVGLWAFAVPHDNNAGGLPDLFVVAGSSPTKGTYYFENTGRKSPENGMDVFRKGKYIGSGGNDITPSYVNSKPRVLGPRAEYPDFFTRGMDGKNKPLPFRASDIHKTSGRIRGEQWSLVDFDGDGILDLVLGVGDWTDYGWDNAYDANGRWTNGPLHGFVYILKNTGSSESPQYAAPFRLQADGRDMDIYGSPSPVFADFRGTGKLDLICGEFLDGLTYFENIGTRKNPVYAPGRRLTYQGKPLAVHLQMMAVAAYDWNKDGRADLVVAQEDGRVMLFENTGNIIKYSPRANPRTQSVEREMPEFLPPRFFKQEADFVKFGVLATPVAVDWDADGLVDIITGNSAGEIAFIKNLGGRPVRWAAPELLSADGKTIHIQAGYNGSIQGPAEAKWGYTNISVADWDGDGLPDIMANSIIGEIIWYQNTGTRAQPRLAAAQTIQAAWDGPPSKPAWNWWDPKSNDLVLQWRCTPYMMDVDGDGVMDLVAPDHEGYLAFFRQIIRDGKRMVLPGQRIFRMQGLSEYNPSGVANINGPSGGPLRMNYETAGRSGRRTFCFADWDGDGKLDLLVNSVNINFLKNVSEKPGEWLFKDMGPVDGKKLAGHSTSPTTADYDGDGIVELLVGAEDGYIYVLKQPGAK